jgi:hypothetical protein
MSDEQEHRDHALSRIYREGAWPEPSRQIDQAILVASRRAARERHPLLWRWAPSLAVAATVVLTSTLVLKVYREQREVVSPGAFDKVEKAETRAKQPGPEPKADAKPAPAPQPVTTPQGYSSTMDAGEAARLERAQRDIGFRDVTSPVGAEVPAKGAPAPKAPPALKKEAEQRRADAPQTPTSGPTVSVFGAQAPAATPPAPTPPAPSQAAPRAFGKPATPFIQNAPQAPEPAQGQARLQAAPAPEAAPQPQASPRPEATQALVTGGVSANALSADAIAARVDARSPQAWIEDIRKLVKEGRSEEAGQEISKFKKRYPDYVLPEDLR